MKLENILAVSNLPGLYRLVTTRSNGLIVEDLDTGKRNFISLRKQQFTPLESVGIFTYTDVANLEEVFGRISKSGLEIPDSGAAPSDYHDFLRRVLPEYDESRVYLTDIKKLVKWYGFLKGRGMLGGEEEE